MNQEVLKVRMFGKFTLIYGDRQISCDNTRSKQIWSILAYLIYYRDRGVSSEELLGLMRNSNKNGNPTGAMRATMHRVRTLLESVMPAFGRQILVYKNGAYLWDPHVPVELDVDAFDSLLSSVSKENDPDDLDRYVAALNLYDGQFLSLQSSETWVMSRQVYYQELYESIVQKALPMLEKTGRYAEAVVICQKALQIDPYSEPMYQHLMRFLLNQGKRQDVIALYERMMKLLLETFGVMPDQESRTLYREALKTVNVGVLSPEMMMEQLEERAITGALICDIDFFRMLYQSQARMVARTGNAVHIALLSLRSRRNRDVTQKQIAHAMDNLEEHMRQSLRKGDVITRCSASQFIIMLPQANCENSCMVCRRVITGFERKYPHAPVYVDFYVNPLRPVNNA